MRARSCKKVVGWPTLLSRALAAIGVAGPIAGSLRNRLLLSAAGKDRHGEGAGRKYGQAQNIGIFHLGLVSENLRYANRL